MKSTALSLSFSFILLRFAAAIGHNGYVYDKSHSYDHKQDLEKLKHPNQYQHPNPTPSQDIHVVDIEAIHAVAGKEECVDDDEPRMSRKAILMGINSRRGPVISNNAVALDNIVTNILEASAAVEREDVFSMNRKRGGE